MFKGLIDRINRAVAERRLRRKNDLFVKKYHIRNELIEFYYNLHQDVVDLPAHYYAEVAMQRTLKTPADIDRSYRKLLNMKLRRV